MDSHQEWIYRRRRSHQTTLFPERIDYYITEDSAVRVIDVFVDELDLSGLAFKTTPDATGRPGYHPALMLKLFIYGYLNRVRSSRRLEQEANRNLELVWLLGRLAPDFKTIADYHKGISTGEMASALEVLVGPEAKGLSPTVIRTTQFSRF